jgi:hypothetical protein
VELEEYADARKELEAVLKIAPDNLAAIRALADIHERHGHGVEEVTEPAAEPVAPEASGPPPMPDFSDWTLDADPAVDLPEPAFAEPPLETTQEDPVLEALEHWLTAIVADRSR